MDTASLLNVVGQIAGIGGLALGILLLIFREVIRKNIFPNLAQVQAYRIIRLIVSLTFVIALSGLAAWVYVQKYADKEVTKVIWPSVSAEPALQSYLALVDQGNVDQSWDAMADVAKEKLDRTIMRSAYQSVRVPLGAVVKRSIVGQQKFEQTPDGTRGAFTNITVTTDFEKGRYTEAVALIG